MSKEKQKKPSFLDKLRAFIDSEAEELKTDDEELESKEEEKTEDEDPYEARFAALEAGHQEILAALAALKPAATGDSDEEEEAKETEDEADPETESEETEDDILEAETAEHEPEAAGKTWDSLRARAEILAPGISVPTADSLKKAKVADALMRKALSAAYATEKGKGAVSPFLAGRKIGQLTGDALHSAFVGAAELMRMQNNAAGIRSAISTKDFGRPLSAADINARNRDFWANRIARNL